MPTAKPVETGSAPTSTPQADMLEPGPDRPLELAGDGQTTEAALITAQAALQIESMRARERLEGPNPMLFFSLLAQAQAEFKPVVRNRTVKVWSQRLQKEYSFTYAELHTVLGACLPALNRFGFFFRQYLDPTDKMILITELLHAHGKLECRTPLFLGSADGQGYNSALTYARRAGANLMFGVAGEDDDDGNLADGNQRSNDVGAARTGSKGKDPTPSGGPGRATPTSTRAAPAPKPEPQPRQATYLESLELTNGVEPPADEEALMKAEGRIVDAAQELIEAAQDGRAHGIEQIWNEIRTDQYVATMVWRRIRADAPDAFRTVKEVLEKAEKAAKANAAPGKRGDRG